MITHGATSVSDGAITLREIAPDDSANLYRWRMDESSRPMFRSTGVVPLEQHERFLRGYFDESNRDRWFIIEDEGRAVGAVALYDVSESGESAESGRLVVAPEHRGHGYSERALRLLVRYAKSCGFRSLHAEVLKENEPSMRAHLAAGYRPTRSSTDGDREFIILTIDLERDE